MYLLQTARKGISSLQLSKELGITQKSSWFLLHRLREACDVEAVRMDGEVEVDETYIGGKERNKHESKKLKAGRGTVGKQAVLGMREREGRVKAKPINDTSSLTIQAEILDSVDEGATLYTDEHPAYQGLEGYEHQSVRHSAKARLQRCVSPLEQKAHASLRERIRVQAERRQRSQSHNGQAEPPHQQRHWQTPHL